ncbi:MAG: histidinol-phosphate transaminase [Gemmatimonadales bacterium]|nr:histidinol-phosphate transaminase [Gemmatimonadales bacterium]
MTPALAPADDALALVKPAVRAQPAYTLAPLPCRRKLNQNEAALDLPAAIKQEVLARAARADWRRYPEFVPQSLLDRLATHYGWRGDGILAGNGSNELIQATLSVALGAGDVVVAPSPTFSLYRLLTNVYGGRYVGVPLGPGFAFDVDALVDAARRERAKVVIVTSPNNPTGSAMPEGTVERLLAGTGALVVCDEAYQEFGGPTAVPLLAAHPRVVVLRTFSKALGLAGLRFGVGLAQPSLATEIAKAKLPYNVNLFTLLAAEVALGHAGEMEARVAETVRQRERLLAGLAALPGLEPFPSAANFILVRCHARPAGELFRRLLDDDGILVRDVSSGEGLAGCLRFSVGTADDVDALLAALRRLVGTA